MTTQTDSKTPVIVLFLVAGAILLAVGFLGGRGDRTPGDGVPALRILAPADGDDVANPVTLRFATDAPLRLSRDGWTAGELHLHVMVDDREIMPAAADITGEDGGFAWTLPALDAGERRVYLTWAGRHHGNIAGATDTVRIVVAH